MPISSVPYLSPDQIESKAEEVIDYFAPEVLKKPQPTPLLDFLKVMRDKHGVVSDLEQDLGFTGHGTKILGIFSKSPLGILIDRSIRNDPGFPYTLGHEIGHLVLHRRLRLLSSEYNFNPDTVRELVTGRRKITNAKERVEWQANRFSASFLMPRETFRQALISIQEMLGVIKNRGIVYVDNSAPSLRDYGQMILCLQNIYAVSKQSIEYRLSDLRLLMDVRDRNVRHISQLFSELNPRQ